jgi:hypothetical protein
MAKPLKKRPWAGIKSKCHKKNCPRELMEETKVEVQVQSRLEAKVVWCSRIRASWYNYESNQQDALCRLIYYSKSAAYVLGNVFAHHQEHLTVFTVSGSVYSSCCRHQPCVWLATLPGRFTSGRRDTLRISHEPGWTQSLFGRFVENKSLYLLPRIEPQLSGSSASSRVTTPTELPRLVEGKLTRNTCCHPV